MDKRYRGLGLIGLLLKIMGILELLVGFAGLIIIPLVMTDSSSGFQLPGFGNLLPGTSMIVGILSGLITFLIASVAGLLTFSMGEIFNLLIAIEANTRMTRIHQQEQD